MKNVDKPATQGKEARDNGDNGDNGMRWAPLLSSAIIISHYRCNSLDGVECGLASCPVGICCKPGTKTLHGIVILDQAGVAIPMRACIG